VIGQGRVVHPETIPEVRTSRRFQLATADHGPATPDTPPLPTSGRRALLGALVIGSIANGMDLLGQTSDVKFMVTGGVLLVAATIDAVSRRGRHAAGRA
jgi:hypothetical protein